MNAHTVESVCSFKADTLSRLYTAGGVNILLLLTCEAIVKRSSVCSVLCCVHTDHMAGCAGGISDYTALFVCSFLVYTLK